MTMNNADIKGHVAPGFETVADVFAQNFMNDGELGAGFSVYRDGECCVDLIGGWADRKRSTPWTPETLVPVYSTTKGIAALVLGGLLQENTADGYETPVSAIWPEFSAKGKDAITIGQIVSHQAGLPGFVAKIDPDLWLDPPACATALAREAPLWTPGTAHGYHPLTWGYLVGEICRRLDPAGRTLGETLSATITHTHSNAPEQDIIDFWIGLPESEHHRCADIQRPKALPNLGEINPATRTAFLEKWSAPNRGGAIWREIEIPSANGHGTAKSVAQLYGAYANEGAIGKSQVTLTNDMIRPRTHGQDLVLPFETSFAAGIMLNSHGLFGPNPTTLGHSGWGGSMAIADSDIGLSCGYVMNKQSNVLVGDPRAVRLVNAVYDCL